jgi:lipid II:glycine glycyltransferase (peptidoglycan interpeptide bridge formation enzyme)
MKFEDYGSELPDWWDETAKQVNSPEASLQSSWWAELKGDFGWSVRRMAVTDKNKPLLMAQILERGLPAGQRFWYSPRGPLWVGPESSKAFGMLAESASKEAALRGVLFWRIDPALEQTKIPLNMFGFKRTSEQLQPDHTLLVDLRGAEEEILAQMKEKGRYNIGLAGRKGVTIRSSEDEKDLKEFYSLEKITAKRDKIVIHNYSYYKKMFEAMTGRGQGELLLAEFEGKVLSAAIVEYFGPGGTYLHGASSNEHRDLMANYLLQWEGMRRAKARGALWYDLRGLAPEDDPHHPYANLRQFKTRFGGKEVHYIGAHDLVVSSLKYGMFMIAERARTSVLRRLA